MGFRRVFTKFFRRYIPFLARYWNHYEIRGLEHIASPGSKLLAINHGGGWDYDNFLIMSALDYVRSNNPARKRIWLFAWDKWCESTEGFEGLWSNLYRPFTVIPIHVEKDGKKPPIPWDLVDEIVERGELMVICPEGHSAARREGYRLWRFYPGVIKVHLRYQIPIIPTGHIGVLQALPMMRSSYDPSLVPPWTQEMPFPIPFPLPHKIFLHLGTPMTFSEHYGRAVDKATMYRLADRVRTEVAGIVGQYRANVSETNPYGVKIPSAYRSKSPNSEDG